jgi:23S rRNA pseudouridine1911/1915/1917 synthase
VTGVMVLARTSKAAARLTEQFRSRAVEKVYWALVEGSPPQAVDCHDFLIKNDRQQRMVVCDPQMVGAQEARLHLHRLAAGRGLTLVEIVLETGRKHQIRVQLSSRGWCVLGDRKYGSHFDWPLGIALHARRLRFEHPTRHEMLDFVAPLPAAWQRRGVGETGQID